MYFILDKKEEVVGVLSNTGDLSKTTPFFDDVFTEDLSTGSVTLEFSTLGNTKEAYYLQVGNYIGFKTDEGYQVLQITSVEEEHTTQLLKHIYCEGISLELLNRVIRPVNIPSANIRQFLTTVLKDTVWKVGIVDIALNSVHSIDLSDYTNVYKALQDIAVGKFGAEMVFRIDIQNNRIVGKYIDVYAQRGRVTKHRFEYGANMTKVKKSVDTSELCTALIGVGNNNITFKEVSADDKPKNQDFIISQSAYDRWNNKGTHIMGVYKGDTDSPDELLHLTRKELKRRSEPKVTYEVDVELLGNDVKIGDEVYVVDMEFSPMMLLSARVSELESSKSGGSNKCKLANFKEVRSNITDDMREIASELEGKLDDKLNSKFPVKNDDIDKEAVTGDKIHPETIDSTHINNLTANKITTGTLDAEKINVVNLNASNITTGTLDANKITVKDLSASSITTGTLDAKKINVTNLNASSIVSGSITADKIATGTITSGSSIIANGAIGSAQISEIKANQISSGTVDTSKVTVSGADGHLQIRGNRLQVFSGLGSTATERVSLGDVNNDGTVFGLRVRGADGKTILLDENGVTEQGITDGSITNDKISGEANIDGAKLDINSVVREVNNGTETITGSKVSIGKATLDVELSEMKNKTTEHGKTLETHTSEIKANKDSISLKVDEQIYTSDKKDMTSKLEKNTSDIKVMKEEISLKVEQTDITTALDNMVIGGNNYVKDYRFEKEDVWSTYRGEANIDTVNNQATLDGTTVNPYVYQFLKQHDIKGGDTFTLQYEIKCWNVDKNTGTDSMLIRTQLSGYDADNKFIKDVAIFGKHESNGEYLNLGEWTKITKTVKVEDVDFNHTALRLYARNFTGVIYFRNIKLEKGNKATDLSPSPEDVDTKISEAKAEIKVTTDGISQTVANNYYSKTDVDSKGYQTESQVQQKVDSLQFKFSESGGYNLLYNGDYKRDLEHWSITNGAIYSFNKGGLSSPDGYGIRITGEMGASRYLVQYITDSKVVSHKSFTISTYMYISSTGGTNPVTDGSTNAFRVYSRVTYTDGTKEYKYAYNKTVAQSSINKWERVSISFDRLDGKKIQEITFSVEIKDTTRYLYLSQAMLESGKLLNNWSPNPNETFDGVTTINKDGITVSNSDSNTSTQMDSQSFRVLNAQGGTVAEFSNNSKTYNMTVDDTLKANTIFANNTPTKSVVKEGTEYTWYVNGDTGNDNNNGGSSSTPMKTLQQAFDNLPDVLNRNQRIKVSGSIPDATLRGLTGSGILTIEFLDNAIMNGRLFFEGITNRVKVTATNVSKGTIKKGISLFNCANVDIYGINMDGYNSGDSQCIIFIRDCQYVALNTIDFVPQSTKIPCCIKVLASTVWTHNLIGSNIQDVIGQFAFSFCITAKTGTIKVPDYSNGYHVAYDGSGRFQNMTGATLQKTPSAGYKPEYVPTQRTRTWDFNKVWSDETLNGWSDRNELIQGYYSGWNSGRWTGYMQMNDNFDNIRAELSGATNLSGRIYVQRTTSSGNSTGSKLCLYGSDGTVVTTTQTIDRGKGVWVTLNSAIVEKIKSGAIKYFYLRADTSDASTYFKCETNCKIELSYKK